MLTKHNALINSSFHGKNSHWFQFIDLLGQQKNKNMNNNLTDTI